MGKRKQQGMSFADAMDLADSMGLPDGAFWAMSHELAGLEYGEGFDQIAAGTEAKVPAPPSSRRGCDKCQRTFGSKDSLRQHKRDRHGMAWKKGGAQP